jgi:hypothetical protein
MRMSLPLAHPRIAPASSDRTASRIASRSLPVLWRIGAAAIVLAGHTLLLWACASLMAGLAGRATVLSLFAGASGDDVYSRLILGMLSSVRLKTFAFPGPLLFTGGSSVVGVQLIQVAAALTMVVAGTFVLAGSRGWRWAAAPVARWLAVVAAGYGSGCQLRLSWSGGSGGEMALSMAATKLLHLDSAQYDAAMAHGGLVSAAINVALISLAAVAGLVLSLLFRKRSRWWAVGPRGRSWSRRPIVAAAGIAACLLGGVQPAVAFDHGRALSPAARPQARLAAMMGSLPSVVTITPSGGGWIYAVNGRREVIRGFGYNPVVDGQTPTERAALYDRDFAAMADAGANTIVGWDEPHFDEVLMDKAAQHNLGVILPFDLTPSMAYEDPAERRRLTDLILRRVSRFRNSPALRMWGLGNEVLHEILRAHGTQVRYDGFAEFLVQTADRIHQLDPNHPVVYRDAEDWYIKPVIKALDDGKRRPWFVYSMNFFTTRLRQALNSGPAATMGKPLMVSEYGPVGLSPESRPAGYRELWEIIREHPDNVLGGLAYVWTTAGPEPLDRSFGLTDANGVPVDGTLEELSSLYSGET